VRCALLIWLRSTSASLRGIIARKSLRVRTDRGAGGCARKRGVAQGCACASEGAGARVGATCAWISMCEWRARCFGAPAALAAAATAGVCGTEGWVRSLRHCVSAARSEAKRTRASGLFATASVSSGWGGVGGRRGLAVLHGCAWGRGCWRCCARTSCCAVSAVVRVKRMMRVSWRGGRRDCWGEARVSVCDEGEEGERGSAHQK
jgi:hypothetical protein